MKVGFIFGDSEASVWEALTSLRLKLGVLKDINPLDSPKSSCAAVFRAYMHNRLRILIAYIVRRETQSTCKEC